MNDLFWVIGLLIFLMLVWMFSATGLNINYSWDGVPHRIHLQIGHE